MAFIAAKFIDRNFRNLSAFRLNRLDKIRCSDWTISAHLFPRYFYRLRCSSCVGRNLLREYLLEQFTCRYTMAHRFVKFINCRNSRAWLLSLARLCAANICVQTNFSEYLDAVRWKQTYWISPVEGFDRNWFAIVFSEIVGISIHDHVE